MKNDKKKIRRTVESILREDKGLGSYDALENRVALALREEEGFQPNTLSAVLLGVPESEPHLENEERLLLEEIYWDLFRDKWITFSPGNTNEFLVHSEMPQS